MLRTAPEGLPELVRGDKAAWNQFVSRYAGLVTSAVRHVAGDRHDIEDIVQDVFVRLCKDDFRLMRQYDAARAGLSTWLTVVARSVAHDTLRRRTAPTQPFEVTPESALAVEPELRETVKIPEGLLSPRQALVLDLLYRREMEVAEVAATLGIDPQTVRSTHHKALLKLRAHFAHDQSEMGMRR